MITTAPLDAIHTAVLGRRIAPRVRARLRSLLVMSAAAVFLPLAVGGAAFTAGGAAFGAPVGDATSVEGLLVSSENVGRKTRKGSRRAAGMGRRIVTAGAFLTHLDDRPPEPTRRTSGVIGHRLANGLRAPLTC